MNNTVARFSRLRELLPWPLAILLAVGLALRVALLLVACHNSSDLSALRQADTHTYLKPGLRHLTWQVTFLTATAAYFFVVSGGPTCVARLRQPVKPLVCLIGGLGLAEALRWLGARKRGRAKLGEELVALSARQAA